MFLFGLGTVSALGFLSYLATVSSTPLPEPAQCVSGIQNFRTIGFEASTPQSHPIMLPSQQQMDDVHSYTGPLAQHLPYEEFTSAVTVFVQRQREQSTKKKSSAQSVSSRQVQQTKAYLACKGVTFEEISVKPKKLIHSRVLKKIQLLLKDKCTSHLVFLPSPENLRGLVDDDPFAWLRSWVNPRSATPAEKWRSRTLKSLNIGECQIKDSIISEWKTANLLGLPSEAFTVNTNIASGHCFTSMYSMIHGKEDGKCVPLKYEDLHVAYAHNSKPKITLIHFKKMIALGARCR